SVVRVSHRVTWASCPRGQRRSTWNRDAPCPCPRRRDRPVSGSTGLSGNNATRYSIRSVAVLLLVLGFAAASGVSATVDTRSGAAAEAASALDSTANVEAYQLEIMRLQRLAEASERADRKRRIGPSVTERV